MNYGFDNRYLLEANFRYDSSVKWIPGKRWGFFPSVSAGWRVTEENFFKQNDALPISTEETMLLITNI